MTRGTIRFEINFGRSEMVVQDCRWVLRSQLANEFVVGLEFPRQVRSDFFSQTPRQQPRSAAQLW